MKYLKGFATVLLWVLVLLSFTANALILRLLVDARAQVAEALQLGSQSLGVIQASALSYTLVVDRTTPMEVVLPKGTVFPTAAGPVELDQDVTVQANVRLNYDVPVKINIADTPFNASLLSTKDFLDRLHTQWERDPLQAFLAPLPR